MSLRSFSLLALFVIAAPCSWFSGGTCDAADPITALEGKWLVVGLNSKGKVISDVSFRGMNWNFTGKTYTMAPGSVTPAGLAGKPPLKGPFSVDDSKTPKHFTFDMVRGESRRTVNAIYRIKEGKLELCFGAMDRPTDFDTAETRNLCYVLERPKPATNDKSSDDAAADEPKGSNGSSVDP